MFGRNWEKVQGKILTEGIHKRHQSDNGQWCTRMKYVVEYERPGAGAEWVELKEPEKFGTNMMRTLTRGMTAPLLVDTKSGKVRFDTDDPQINLKAWISQSKRNDEDDPEKVLKG